MPGSRRRGRGASRAIAALLLLACAALAGSALVAVQRSELALRVLFAEWFVPIAAGLGLAVLVDLAALLLLLARWRAEPPAWRPRLAPRVVAYSMLAAAVAYLVALQPYRSLVAHVCFGLAAGLPGLAALVGEALLGKLPRQLVLVVDLLLFLVCLLGVGGELALRVIASTSSSPLFARSSDSMLDFMARYRLKPGQASPGFPVNSLGHFDVEFGARTPGVPRAATIGDSFSTSVVPHPYHFTTVAERVLGRGEVCNIGIAGMGPQRVPLPAPRGGPSAAARRGRDRRLRRQRPDRQPERQRRAELARALARPRPAARARRAPARVRGGARPAGRDAAGGGDRRQAAAKAWTSSASTPGCATPRRRSRR
jgi:hypothetical protein